MYNTKESINYTLDSFAIILIRHKHIQSDVRSVDEVGENSITSISLYNGGVRIIYYKALIRDYTYSLNGKSWEEFSEARMAYA